MTLLAEIAEINKSELIEALSGILEENRKQEKKVRTCPSCGFNLINDKVIIKDGFVLDPRGRLYYKEKEVEITGTPLRVLYSIAKENGRPLSFEAIANRSCHSEKTEPRTLVKLYVHWIKKSFKERGLPFPIRNERGLGYYWQVA